jgi:hypothetical protein
MSWRHRPLGPRDRPASALRGPGIAVDTGDDILVIWPQREHLRGRSTVTPAAVTCHGTITPTKRALKQVVDGWRLAAACLPASTATTNTFIALRRSMPFPQAETDEERRSEALQRVDDGGDVGEAELDAASGAAPQLLALRGVPDGRPATRCSAPIRVAMKLQRPSPPSSRGPTRRAHPKPTSWRQAGLPRCLRWACLHPSGRST